MANALLYYLIVINVVTFLVYGIDKAASKRGQLPVFIGNIHLPIRKYWLTKSLQSPLESLINRENFAAAQAAVEE